MSANKIAYLKNYIGRTDVLAEGFLSQEKSGYRPVKLENGQLDSMLQDHLDGKKVLGTYLIDQDSMVKFCVIDIDDPKDLDVAKRIYQDIREKLQFKLNIPCVAEFSGKKGYHLWIFFKDRVSAEIAEKFGKIIIHYCGYPHLEVFPKQGSVSPEKPYGNLVKLPLGVHPKDPTKKSRIRPADKLIKIDTSLVDSICESYKDILETKTKPSNLKNKTNLCVTRILEEGVGEGERNEAIGVLSAYFRSVGLSKELAVKNLEDWKRKNDPTDHPEIPERVESIYDRELSPWSCSRIQGSVLERFCDQEKCADKPKEEYEKEGFAIPIQPISQLVKENQDGQQWLIHKLVPIQSVIFICGYPKTYKTWFAIDMAISLSEEGEGQQGGKFLGYRTRRSKVVYWQQELSNSTIADRFRLMCGVKPNPNLYHVPFTGRGMLNLLDERHQQKIEKFIQVNRPNVIIIDPLVHFLGGCDENSNTNIQAIISFCNRVKVNYGVSWVIVHHARKSYGFNNEEKRVSLHDMRGASSLPGWGDAFFFLNNPKVTPLITVDLDFVLRHAEYLPTMKLIMNRTNHRFRLKLTTDVVISYVRTRKSVSGREVKDAFSIWRNEKYIQEKLNEGIEMGEIVAKQGKHKDTIYEYKFFSENLEDDEIEIYE